MNKDLIRFDLRNDVKHLFLNDYIKPILLDNVTDAFTDISENDLPISTYIVTFNKNFKEGELCHNRFVESALVQPISLNGYLYLTEKEPINYVTSYYPSIFNESIIGFLNNYIKLGERIIRIALITDSNDENVKLLLFAKDTHDFRGVFIPIFNYF